MIPGPDPSPLSIAVVNRFFQALDELKAQRVIRGKQTFTREYDINRWNMNVLQKNPDRLGMFHIEWLIYLVRDYGVSAEWLLLGSGPFFAHKKR